VALIPAAAKAGSVHLITQVDDDAEPHLASYRRAFIEVRA
jgi:hypothetical protein